VYQQLDALPEIALLGADFLARALNLPRTEVEPDQVAPQVGFAVHQRLQHAVGLTGCQQAVVIGQLAQNGSQTLQRKVQKSDRLFAGLGGLEILLYGCSATAFGCKVEN